MKIKNLSVLLIAVAVLFSISPALVGAAGGPPAPTPLTVDITDPTTGVTVYVPSFPANVDIMFIITHNPLKDVGVLNVEVDSISIFSGGNAIGNPFDIDNMCSGQMVLPNISFCSTNELDEGTVKAPWLVPEPGTYTITVSSKHTGVGEAVTDSEEADIQLSLVNVEYPAPPAVANAYLNSLGIKIKGGVRGCIISAIANNHAWYSAYGPKGGPYNIPLIEGDADALLLSCQ
jgi:hypothetical protein